MARCPARKGNHCWHESDHIQYTVNPPIYQCTETCCHCGKKRTVKHNPSVEGGHGQYGPTKIKYEKEIVAQPDL